jgi:hypothetical protein
VGEAFVQPGTERSDRGGFDFEHTARAFQRTPRGFLCSGRFPGWGRETALWTCRTHGAEVYA